MHLSHVDRVASICIQPLEHLGDLFVGLNFSLSHVVLGLDTASALRVLSYSS